MAARRKAIEQVNQRMRLNDPNMLRARGDAARKGLYGFPADERVALKFYERARGQEAGFNAALILYRAAIRDGVDQATAKRILDVLHRSGASAANSRGMVGAQAHYIAGLLHESGLAGAADTKKAFAHYRSSGRNGYVPGAYHYLRLLSQSLPKLPEAERQVVLQELRMMTNRWRWQSPDIMLLTGDMYANKWFPDDGGYMAQYHWRMASKMTGHREIQDFDAQLQQRLKKLSVEKEKRLDEAVESGLRNVHNLKHELEFADLCAE